MVQTLRQIHLDQARQQAGHASQASFAWIENVISLKETGKLRRQNDAE
jgi:protein involved in temperature-dependent protein secretion